MAHQFEIPVKGDVGSIIDRAKTAIEKVEGTLIGDGAQGTFLVPAKIGDVEGSYQLSGSNLIVTIDKKPFFAPYSMIEDALRKYME